MDLLKAKQLSPEISYEGINCLCKKYKQFEPQISEKQIFKQNGVYLITGGAGHLGKIISFYLAKNYKAQLIITGRSSLEVDIKTHIQELKSLGSHAIYLQADVSNNKEMEDVIIKSKELFKHINGVIHLSGIMSSKVLIEKTDDEFLYNIRPKIIGALVLDNVTQKENLDCFILFSSLSSILGDFGQCDYAISNRFLDEFALWRESMRYKNKRNGKSISINWPLWREGGMHGQKDAEELYLKSSGMRYLENNDGLKAFDLLMQQNLSQAILINGNKDCLWGYGSILE